MIEHELKYIEFTFYSIKFNLIRFRWFFLKNFHSNLAPRIRILFGIVFLNLCWHIYTFFLEYNYRLSKMCLFFSLFHGRIIQNLLFSKWNETSNSGNVFWCIQLRGILYNFILNIYIYIYTRVSLFSSLSK